MNNEIEKLIQKIEQWAHERNLILGSDTKSQTLKLMAEAGELADSINKGTDARDDIGDCIVVLIILAAQKGYELSECIAYAYEDIKDRKGVMYKGVFVKETDPIYDDVLRRMRLNNEH